MDGDWVIWGMASAKPKRTVAEEWRKGGKMIAAIWMVSLRYCFRKIMCPICAHLVAQR